MAQPLTPRSATVPNACWAAARRGCAALLLCATAAAIPLHASEGPTAEVLAEGLEHPWALAFLPDGRFLVTERPGRMRIVEADGRLQPPLAGVPAVVARGQGGLLDVLLDREHARNQQLYFCYAEADPAGGRGNSTAVARARLDAAAGALREVRVIFRQQPKVDSSLHFGCRIVQAPDGLLFVTLGERNTHRADAQTLDNHHGKVVRIAPDGTVPPGNPLQGRAGALPEIWSWGHRNPQGATWGPDGRLWVHEHGPQGGDEINRPEPGRNYGWPVVTHGENYGGGRIGVGTQQPGMEPPLHHWTPSIAPSGMAFVTSDRYGAEWRGRLVVGSLKFMRLHVLELREGRVMRDEAVLTGLGQRVRDVREGPHGWLYLLTDSPQGRLLRLRP